MEFLSNYANGLADCIGELLGSCIDGLAKGLISPATVIANCCDCLSEIFVKGDVVGFSCLR